jgi:hypothetical protein
MASDLSCGWPCPTSVSRSGVGRELRILRVTSGLGFGQFRSPCRHFRPGWQWTLRGSSPVPVRAEGPGPCGWWLRRPPPPRPQRLSSGPARQGESNQHPLLANSRPNRRLPSLNTFAAQLVGLMLGWCQDRCRTFLEYGPVRLVLPSTAPGFAFENGRAATSPASRVAVGMLWSFPAALILRWFGTQPPGSQPPPEHRRPLDVLARGQGSKIRSAARRRP